MVANDNSNKNDSARSESAWELQVVSDLHRLTDRISVARDLGAAAEEMLDAVLTLVGEDCGTVQLLDRTTGKLNYIARRGVEIELLTSSTADEEAHSPWMRALQTRTRVVVEDFETDSSTAYRSTAKKLRFRAALSTPMMIADQQIVGILTVFFREPHTPSERELGLTWLYVRQAAHLIERARIDTILRESQERYRTIFEESNDIILTADLQQRITSCNPAMAAILELDPSKIIGHSISTFTVADNFSKTSAMLSQKLREGGSTRYEVDVRASSGRRMTWEVNSRLTFDASGKPTGLHAIARDVTEKREAHNAALTSEARFRAAVNAVSGIVWTTNAAGQMEGVQPAWTALTGQTRGEYQGDGWTNAVHGDEREATLIAWRTAVAERRTFDFEHRVRRIDGQWRLFAIRGIPVLDSEGAVREWVGVHTDITERKLAEVALREADQRKDEFLAMLAHELRNPLAPIRTAAQVLKLSASAEPRVIRTSEIIVRQVEHMTEIVDDLLEVSRVTRGLIELDRKPVNLKDAIAAAAEQCQPAMEGRSQRLTLLVPDETIEVNADAIRLVQIFSNLIGNAVKYTGEHGSILLSVEPKVDHVRINITDTGAGIAPDMLPRVFELFTQADRSIARSQGGLGLGLALVKRLVELHGGTVEARSEGLGRGSVFSVCLPRLSAASPANADRPATTDTSTLGALAPLHLMIVDDNKDAADLLGVLLEMEGHRVSVEYDAQAAIRRARDAHPSVLLLDIGLPVMDGYELARQLRSHPSTAASTLIAVTGYGRDDDRQRSREAGFDHHLVKPVNPDEINKLLNELAGRGGVR